MFKRLWASLLAVSVGIGLLSAPADAPGRPDGKKESTPVNGPVGWRNDGTGQFPAASPPRQWAGDKNVVWKVPMPGASYGAPIVVGDFLFVVSDPAELLCVRRSDGKVLWRKANGDIKAPPAPKGFGAFRMGDSLAKPLMAALDANKDGKLTREELAAGVKRFFKAADRDGTGKLDEKAIADGLGRILPAQRGGARPGAGRFGAFNPAQRLAGEIVKRADANKDGSVTEAELAAAAEALFKEADKGKKDKLDETAVAAGVNLLFPRPNFGRGGFGGFGPGTMLAGAIVKRAGANKNGSVTEADLVAAAEALFKEADKGKKGKLDEGGVAAGINLLSPMPKGGRGGPGGFRMGAWMAKPLLEALDADKDGKLSQNELAAGVKRFFKDANKENKGKLDEKAIADGLNRIAPRPQFGRPGGGGPGGPGGSGGLGMGGMSAGNTAATPVSDGKHVACVFANGVATVYTLDGKRLWGRFVESPQVGFGHAASPLLIGGKLIVHFKDLVALDVATGKEAWRVSLQASHASPVAARLGKEDVVISPAGAVIRAGDGKVLARGDFSTTQSTPVVSGDTLYIFGLTLEAHKLGGNGKGEVTLTRLWNRDGAGEMHHIPSPVVHDGLIYGVTTAGFLEVLDARTGEAVYRQRLATGQVYGSVTMAGGLLFVVGTNGKAVVFKPGRRFQRVAVNELEATGSCPVFADSYLYLRGQKNLYCLESKEKP